MFKKTFSGKIISSDGFEVRIRDRATVEYKDRNGEVLVSGEALVGKGVSWVLYPEDMRFDAYRGPAEPEDRRRIVDRIKEAFDFAGYRISID